MLLQIQPNVVVVSSKMDDNMQRTLHSYGIWGGESNNSLSRVRLFHDLMLSLAAKPENSTGGGTVATIEVLPSSDFRKQISLIYARKSYDYKCPKSLPPSCMGMKLMNSCSYT